MSAAPTPLGIPFDLYTYQPNYLIAGSLREVFWSGGGLFHISIFWPVGTIATGEHYFEWRPKFQTAVIALHFHVNPCFDFHSHNFASPSTRFTGLHIHHFARIFPTSIDDELYKLITHHGQIINVDLTPLIFFLEAFIHHYYCPTQSEGTPPTSPLEPNQ